MALQFPSAVDEQPSLCRRMRYGLSNHERFGILGSLLKAPRGW